MHCWPVNFQFLDLISMNVTCQVAIRSKYTNVYGWPTRFVSFSKMKIFVPGWVKHSTTKKKTPIYSISVNPANDKVATGGQGIDR
jgi:hypothetical protein